MHVFQALNLVSIVVDTLTATPKVNVELENATYLRVSYRRYDEESFSRFYMFPENVTWPGAVKVDSTGIAEILLFKEKSGIWESQDGFYLKLFYEGLKKVLLPDFYECQVVDEVLLNDNFKYLQLLINDRRVYSHIGPSEILDVKQTVNGKEWIVPFATVPSLPLFNLSYPNEKPNEWRSSSYPVNLMINRNDGRALNRWLLDREIGDKVIIGNPRVNFSVDFLADAEYLFLVANEIGLAPTLSLALWILQVTNETKVYLGVYGTCSNSTFWRKDIENIARMENRFHPKFVLKENTRHGRMVDLQSFRSAFPVQGKHLNNTFVCVAGRQLFVEHVLECVNRTLNLPRHRIHIFKEIDAMFEIDEELMVDSESSIRSLSTRQKRINAVDQNLTPHWVTTVRRKKPVKFIDKIYPESLDSSQLTFYEKYNLYRNMTTPKRYRFPTFPPAD